MGGSMQQRIAKDTQWITGKGGFEIDIAITPVGEDPVTVQGFYGKHSITDGERAVGGAFIKVNLNKAYVGFSERNLIAAGITTRDSNGNLLKFEKYLVTFTDESGQEKTYIIQRGAQTPDQTTGYMKFILSEYTPDLV